MEYLFIFISLLFTTVGQLLQKLAANKAVAMPVDSGYLQRMLSLRETWLAITCLAIGAALWLVVLYKMEVSKAFPFLSLGFVFVLLISRYFLHEKIHRTRWFGVLFIVVGISILSMS